MKKAIIIISILLAGCRSNQKKLSGIRNLPAFKIISLDSTKLISTGELQIKTTALFFYFNPDCEHCQKQTKDLLKYSQELQNTHIYMLTEDTSEYTKSFYEHYRLDTAKNFSFGRDFSYSFYNAFLPPSSPYMAIYDKNKKLRKIYREATSIESIINTCKENPNN